MTGESSTHICYVQREGWQEVFATAVPREPVEDRGALECFFRQFVAELAAGGVEVLHQKVLAEAAWEGTLREVHDAAFGGSDQAPPFTLLEGRACLGGRLAGVQVVGARRRSPGVSLEVIREEGRANACLLETPTQRRLYLAEVTGLDPVAPGTGPEQTRAMLEGAERRLREHGFEYRDVIRTWIYLPRLLEWYDDFNVARSACYREFGILGPDAVVPLPASTGIQARRREHEEVLLDLVAYQVPGTRSEALRPAHNPRQNEAYDYGSSFSRGMVVDGDGPRMVYISGTASIDGTGRTVYLDDSQGQILETLLDVGALLGSEGLGLGDIRHAVAYCKRPEDFATWQEIRRTLQIPDFPVLPVYGDVCRDDLLFELEALAVADAGPLGDA